MSVSRENFNFISNLVKTELGIVLEEGKEYLIDSRLSPVMRKQGFSEIEELVDVLKRGADLNLRQLVLDSLTTNETLFFRDGKPFEGLRQVLIPDLIKRRADQRKIRIWCAAASSGQEPYSIAILILEHFPELANWDVKILATDISAEILERAKEGKYSQFEVNRGLPAALLTKYFKRTGMKWCLNSDIRDRVEFRELNLLGRFDLVGVVDIVLIRNVLIYFDEETKCSILRKIRGVMAADGVMMVGGAESILNLDSNFEREVVCGWPVYSLQG